MTRRTFFFRDDLMRFNLLLFLAMAFFPSLSRAAACDPIGPSVVTVQKFTNYAPSIGGINGNCNTSASGLAACKYLLEDYLAGRNKAVMVAVPQPDCPRGYRWVGRGKNKRKERCSSRCPDFPNAALYGGLYRSLNFEGSLRQGLGQPIGCVQLAAADRYGPSGNCVNKVDVVTKHAKSTYSVIVNSTNPGALMPIGRLANIPAPRRTLARDPVAMQEVNKDAHKMRAYTEEFAVMTPEKRRAEKQKKRGKKYQQTPGVIDFVPQENPNAELKMRPYYEEFGVMTAEMIKAEKAKSQGKKYQQTPQTMTTLPTAAPRDPAGAGSGGGSVPAAGPGVSAVPGVSLTPPQTSSPGVTPAP